MKRIFYILLLFAVLLSVTACGAGKPTIVGTWQGADGEHKLEYVFREDGTGTATAGDNTAEFTYSIDDGCITVTIGGNTDTASVEITDKTLSITDEYGTTTLTRK